MQEILEVKFIGGLCNKLFCLFSACEIAINDNIQLLEPKFGWKRPIFFSDIYDLEFFNENMKKYSKIQNNLIIPFNQRQNFKIKKNNIDLWKYSENHLKKQRAENLMSESCMNIIVLKCLKLKKDYDRIINSFNLVDSNAIHIRIESDWQKYSIRKQRTMESSEIMKINLDDLVKYYKLQFGKSDIFFTTGENQLNVKNKFCANSLKSNFYFDPKYEYEINAAINFELCCKANNFIGLTRSTFSNLISLKRYLINKNNSFIYNYNSQILKRLDFGLHNTGKNAVNNVVTII